MRSQIDNSVLEMALVGLNVKRDEIIQRMAEIHRQLGGRSKAVTGPMVTQGPAAAKKVKRTMSAAARKRIADAQKLRWAKFHAAQKPAVAAKKASLKKVAVKRAAPKTAAPKNAPPRKKMSAERKAALVANLAKARAAKAAKKTEGEAVPF